MQVIGRCGNRGEGPYMHIFLECEAGQVQSAIFETYGCPSAIRCGEWVARWATGRELATLSLLEPNDLIVVVGGLPLGKEFCADMTVKALRQAIEKGAEDQMQGEVAKGEVLSDED